MAWYGSGTFLKTRFRESWNKPTLRHQYINYKDDEGTISAYTYYYETFC